MAAAGAPAGPAGDPRNPCGRQAGPPAPLGPAPPARRRFPPPSACSSLAFDHADAARPATNGAGGLAIGLVHVLAAPVHSLRHPYASAASAFGRRRPAVSPDRKSVV